jgi:hypothetical protein
MEKSEGKDHLEHIGHALEDNIKVDLKAMERQHGVEYSGSG